MRGLISELLNDASTHPVSKEKLMIVVTKGRSCCKHNFNSHNGTGSSSQELSGEFLTIFCISSSEAGVNFTRQLSTDSLSVSKLKVSTPGPTCGIISFLIPCILSLKNSLKSWAISFGDFPEGKIVSLEPCNRCFATLCKLF